MFPHIEQSFRKISGIGWSQSRRLQGLTQQINWPRSKDVLLINFHIGFPISPYISVTVLFACELRHAVPLRIPCYPWSVLIMTSMECSIKITMVRLLVMKSVKSSIKPFMMIPQWSKSGNIVFVGTCHSTTVNDGMVEGQLK